MDTRSREDSEQELFLHILEVAFQVTHEEGPLGEVYFEGHGELHTEWTWDFTDPMVPDAAICRICFALRCVDEDRIFRIINGEEDM